MNPGWAVVALLLAVTPAQADRVEIPGPAGSGSFGESVTVLPNGNWIVTDSSYSTSSGISGVGAVYLYNPKGVLLSTLTGSTAQDRVGSGGIVIVGSGNFVVCSPQWNDGAVSKAGAVTWVSGTAGLSGTVSASNSLIGSSAGDSTGAANGSFRAVTVLPSGNYVVCTPTWGGTAARGAVTWGSGLKGITGGISVLNSLIGSNPDDKVGNHGVDVLSNGNYVIRCPEWNNGFVPDVGAVAWCSGTAGTVGVLSAANSLVGSSAGDSVGLGDDNPKAVTPLTNGNYVVLTRFWSSSTAAYVGAVTWGDGAKGTRGAVSSANSVTGSSSYDFRDWSSVTPLKNGNYVFCVPAWNAGTEVDAGAAMWCSGKAVTKGTINATNAVIGTLGNSLVGFGGAIPLSGPNYVVCSPDWRAGAAPRLGAVTWGNGVTGTTGIVSSANSLIGSVSQDMIGSGGVVALTNTHYVVLSPNCSIGGMTRAGAATWCNGGGGRAGAVSGANSLTGAKADDQVSSGGVTPLSNGNYVVASPTASNGALVAAGAVTWGNGKVAKTGAISLSNSLMGSHTNDRAGGSGVTALVGNGNYLVGSGAWNEGLGALTWGRGTSGVSGAISSNNSLTGTTVGDEVGSMRPFTLSNGHYIALTPAWTRDGQASAGAATWGNGAASVSGQISPANSLVGVRSDDKTGSEGVVELSDGSCLIRSANWSRLSAAGAGAVTWTSGATALSGEVSEANSLVGSGAEDRAGDGPSQVTADGGFIQVSPQWGDHGANFAGAVTLIPPAGARGPVSSSNGVLGSMLFGGSRLVFDYDPTRKQMFVGQPDANRVTIFSYSQILTPAEKFNLWASAAGLQGTAATPAANPAGDGLNNLIKYAFNLNPAVIDLRTLEPDGSAGLPRFSLSGSGTTATFEVEYLRRKNSGLTYRPMVSTEMQTFLPMTGDQTVTDIDADWERITLFQTIDIRQTPKLFGRVEVTLP